MDYFDSHDNSNDFQCSINNHILHNTGNYFTVVRNCKWRHTEPNKGEYFPELVQNETKVNILTIGQRLQRITGIR